MSDNTAFEPTGQIEADLGEHRPSYEVVDKSVYLAARLRQALVENDGLRQIVLNLQAEVARLMSDQLKEDIAELETEFGIVVGETISARPDGTYWRVFR